MTLMLTRRQFAGALTALTGNPGRARCYSLDVFQLPRMQAWLSNSKARPGPKMVLEAVIAPYLPQVAVITGFSSVNEIPKLGDQAGYFELRAYCSQIPARLFHRSGIHPMLCARMKTQPFAYLIPFDSLAAREKAWRTFDADPEWAEVRKTSTVTEISLWRAAPYSPVS
jgi:hypothetical protein